MQGIRYNFKAQILLGLVFGLIQGGMMIGFYYISEDELSSRQIKMGVFQGITMAIFLGLILPFISSWRRSKKMQKIDEEIKPLLNAEGIIYEGPANLLRKLDPVEGKMFLTRKKLFFVPEDLSNASRRIAISIEEIEEVQKLKTKGFLQNNLSVKTPEWNYKFTVVKCDLWLEMIETTMGLQHREASGF